MKTGIYPGRGSLPDWNNPDMMTSCGLLPRASLIPFPEQASCQHATADNRRYLSPFVMSLQDGWEKRFYANILQLPESILSFRSGFEQTTLPALAPDADQRSTSSCPFPVTPPNLNTMQPVLVLRRTCRLPLGWTNHKKKIVLQGIKSAGHVFVNGRLAGYCEGTGLPAEFEITNSLHDADNEIFLLIYPSSTGSFLEDQETSLLPGLIRDIWIEAVPTISIHDVQCRTTSDEGDSWQLDLEVLLVSYRISTDSPRVRISLKRRGDLVAQSVQFVTLQTDHDQLFGPPVQTLGHLMTSLTVEDAEIWSDETPNLYDLFVSVEERGGKGICCVHQSVGFRQVSWQNEQLLLNDRAIHLRGLTWPAQADPCSDRDNMHTMIRTLKNMKKSGLNTLYIQDIPEDPILLELCDLMGIYVVDEAPLALCHTAVSVAFSDDPIWHRSACHRLTRLIRRDYNHPSIILWSAGLFRQDRALSESLRPWLDKLDPTRPLHILDTPDVLNSLGQIEQVEGRHDWFSIKMDQLDSMLIRELNQLFKPLSFSAVNLGRGIFSIRNLMNWLPSSQYILDWMVIKDGHVIMTGKLENIQIKPGEDQIIELSLDQMVQDETAEYRLRFEASYAQSEMWSEFGEEAFFSEFILAEPVVLKEQTQFKAAGRLRLEADRHQLIVSGSRFWMVFNRLNGSLESWRMGDHELIRATQPNDSSARSGLVAALWRHPDLFDLELLEAWRSSGYDRLTTQVLSVQDGCDGQEAAIEMVVRFAASGQPAAFEEIIRYVISANGMLDIFTSLIKLDDRLPPIPANGLLINLNKDFDRVRWFGGGPECAYYNLHDSLRRGIYSVRMQQKGSCLLDDTMGVFPDTAWMQLEGSGQKGLSIQAGQPFGFAIRPVVHQGSVPVDKLSSIQAKPPVLYLFGPAEQPSTVHSVRMTWRFSPVIQNSSDA